MTEDSEKYNGQALCDSGLILSFDYIILHNYIDLFCIHVCKAVFSVINYHCLVTIVLLIQDRKSVV